MGEDGDNRDNKANSMESFVACDDQESEKASNHSTVKKLSSIFLVDNGSKVSDGGLNVSVGGFCSKDLECCPTAKQMNSEDTTGIVQQRNEGIRIEVDCENNKEGQNSIIKITKDDEKNTVTACVKESNDSLLDKINTSKADDDIALVSVVIGSAGSDYCDTSKVSSRSRFRLFKLTALCLLFLIGGIILFFLYKFARDAEIQSFQVHYFSQADQLLNTLHTETLGMMKAIRSLAMQLQSHAITTKQVWPFVTLPFFEERVLATKPLLNSCTLRVLPFVPTVQRDWWEIYSITNRDWINASYDTIEAAKGLDSRPIVAKDDNWFTVLWSTSQGYTFVNEDNIDYSNGVPNTIVVPPNKADGRLNPKIDVEDGPYFPQWQVSPLDSIHQSSINLNYAYFGSFNASARIASTTGKATLGHIWSDSSLDGGKMTTIVYPVFDSIHASDKKVTALLGVDIAWESYFANVLPLNAREIFVALDSICQSEDDSITITYRLNSSGARLVENKDLHDITNTNDFVTTNLSFNSPDDSSLSGSKILYDGVCEYKVRIYPSSDTDDVDVDVVNKPIILLYASIGMLIFSFIVGVLILYGCHDEQYQSKKAIGLQSADETPSFVPSSPASTRERSDSNKTIAENPCRGFNCDPMLSKSIPAAKLVSTVGDPHADDIHDNLRLDAGLVERDVVVPNAVAESFPKTTVLFADLAGFPQWNSCCDSIDVFLMLEVVQNAFDFIAAKHNVLKVETIGDCHVAITGLSKSQAEHAIIMVNFAHDIIQTLPIHILDKLPPLGCKMIDLAFRFGIHSGAVIAGSLRGCNASRFKVFGDTLNTALLLARSSEKNRIHCSHETADLLRAKGKGNWVFAREYQIDGGSKGKLQTFWIQIHSSTRPSMTSPFQSTGQAAVEDDDDYYEVSVTETDYGDEDESFQRRPNHSMEYTDTDPQSKFKNVQAGGAVKSEDVYLSRIGDVLDRVVQDPLAKFTV